MGCQRRRGPSVPGAAVSGLPGPPSGQPACRVAEHTGPAEVTRLYRGMIVSCHPVHPLKCTSLVFSVFTQLCGPHHYLIPECFVTPPQRNPSLSSVPVPVPHSPWLICFLSLDFPIPGIAGGWTHTVAFCVQLLSLSTALSRFFHASFLFTAKYPIVWVHPVCWSPCPWVGSGAFMPWLL